MISNDPDGASRASLVFSFMFDQYRIELRNDDTACKEQIVAFILCWREAFSFASFPTTRKQPKPDFQLLVWPANAGVFPAARFPSSVDHAIGKERISLRFLLVCVSRIP